MPCKLNVRGGLVIALALALPLGAAAGDGVIEINQTCAVQTGCFAGDTVGFPVTIDQPGSYRLSSDLIAGAAAVVGVIDIQSDFVTLDLGGFQVVGDNLCLGNPPAQNLLCTGGFVDAIRSTGMLGVEVRHGSVVGAHGSAVELGDASIVRAVKVSEAAARATFAGTGARFHDVEAYRSSGGNMGGTHFCDSCLITEASSFESGSDGIGGYRSLVLDSLVQKSRESGIDVSDSLVARSVGADNGFSGLRVLQGIVERSSALSNRKLAISATGHGINLINFGLILECTAFGNFGQGFGPASTSVSVGYNTATLNGGGSISGLYKNLGGNWLP